VSVISLSFHQAKLFGRAMFEMTPALIHDGTIYVDLCGLTDRH
jgi:hypothetical protein